MMLLRYIWGVFKPTIFMLAVVHYAQPTIVMAAPLEQAAESMTHKPSGTKHEAAESDEHKMQVYIDTVTGKRTMPPVSSPVKGATSPGMKSILPRARVSIPPVYKEYNLGPGKGHAIDMRGHYSRTEAHIRPDGTVEHKCADVSIK